MFHEDHGHSVKCGSLNAQVIISLKKKKKKLRFKKISNNKDAISDSEFGSKEALFNIKKGYEWRGEKTTANWFPVLDSLKIQASLAQKKNELLQNQGLKYNLIALN